MSRRKIQDEAEARSCLAAMEAAGGNLRSWAREQGIDGRSLHAWRVNFAKWGDKAPASRARQAPIVTTSGLVELVPTPQALKTPVSSRTGRYVLEVGGARVEFDDNFSEPTLRRVLGMLRSC